MAVKDTSKIENEGIEENNCKIQENEDCGLDTQALEENSASSAEPDTVSTDESYKQKGAENKELIDRMQRLAAEFDNFRKRTQKEKEKIYCDSCAEIVSKFLPVADNLERALNASEADDGKSLKDGVILVFRQLSDILDKLGVKAIDALGKPFDPNLHYAVMHVEDEGYGANEIIEELQKGYIYKDDTVIRHSMVKVAN